MRASSACGGRSLSQYSQFGRSSIIASSFVDLTDRRCGVAQPGPVVAPEHRLDLAPDPRVIGVQPGELRREELFRIDQTAVEGNEGKCLESHHLPVSTLDRLRRRHQYEILESDAVSAFEIEA